MNKSVAIYARVSTDEQKKNYSLPTQLDACRDYVRANGYTIMAEFQEDYTGTELDRPELDKVRALAATGAIDTVITLEIDRMAREMVHQLIIEDEFKRQGVTIKYVLGEYDDTPEGRLQKHIRATVAQYEREKLLARTKRGKIGFIKAGNVPPGRVPLYGYRYIHKSDENKSQYEIIDMEAETVRNIYTWFTFGDEIGRKLGTQKIAARLSEMRIPTAFDTNPRGQGRDRPAKVRRYGVWNEAVVARILRCEAYTGTLYYGKGKRVKDPKTGKSRLVRTDPSQWIAVQIPAIISREIFDLARKQAAENLAKSPRRMKNPYLLRGTMTCSRCGYAFVGSTDHGYPRYRCGGTKRPNYPDGKTQICHGQLNAEHLDALTWDAVKALLLTPDNLMNGIRQKQSEVEPRVTALSGRLETVNRELAQRQQQRERLLDLYLDPTTTLSKTDLAERDAALRAAIEGFSAEKTSLEQKLANTAIPDSIADDILETCRRIREGIEDFTFEDKRDALELLRITGMVQRGETRDQDVLIIDGIIPRTTIRLSGENGSMTNNISEVTTLPTS